MHEGLQLRRHLVSPDAGQRRTVEQLMQGFEPSIANREGVRIERHHKFELGGHKGPQALQ